MNYLELYNEPKSKYFASEDSNFVSGDSPVVLDINSELLTNSVDGQIYCTSNAHGIYVEFSSDGTNYGNKFTIIPGEKFSLFGLKIKKIRISHIGSDSSYRVFAR